MAGGILLLRGRNGAGKTSLLRVIAGLVPLASGQLTFDGGAEDIPIGEQCHFIGHHAAIKPALTVFENLQFWMEYRGAEGDPLAALKTTGIAHLRDLPAQFLSAGQQRRLALSRLVAIDRPIWLLDEPQTALDTDGIGMVVDLMRSHAASGGIIVAATHAEIDLPAESLELVMT